MKRLLVGTALLAIMATPALAQTDSELNDPAYWESYFPNTSHCVKHETPSDTPHGQETDTGVVLNPIQPAWGTYWTGLVIKAGTGRAIYELPQPGVEYLSPEGREPSHWIVCKASEEVPPSTTSTTTTTTAPTTTTTAPPSTTSTSTTSPPTTTTTAPPTTTTVTTVPPSTTTTSTTAPPTTVTTSSTTQPPTTTSTPPSTVPPTINIDIYCEWDNRDKATGAHEPIISMWDYTDPEPFLDWQFAYVVYDRTGTLLGTNEFGLTTPTRHDSWVSDENVPVPEDGFTVEFLINGVVDRVIDDPACMADPPATTTSSSTPPPTLPVTGPSEDLGAIALVGLGLLTAGLVTVATVRSRGVS